MDQAALMECTEACFDRAQARTAYEDACLAEGDAQMLARCLRLDLVDYADVSDATGRILS